MRRNYPMWQFTMDSYRISKGLLGLIIGTKVIPILLEAPTQANPARESMGVSERLFATTKTARQTKHIGEETRVKSLIGALASIDASPSEDMKFNSMLNGLREDERWKSFISSIMTRDILPSFEDLKTLMMTEEINIEGANSYHLQRGSQGKALYTSSNTSRGRANWRGGGRFNNNARERGSFNATRGGRTIQQRQQTQPMWRKFQQQCKRKRKL
ncbi:hypothetical protein KP509_10G047100 [Ceratopteris richardii]|uniref:Uncharacterized protein n=1 Tax=Ceratopteris richardii TaxID=49495 RepID=A0A8T2TYM7_CERRI|nr:hypothetical protein KP509_10G047100 [Ceratopteris richardii]